MAILVLAVLAFTQTAPVFAASASPAGDTLSRQQVSVPANHEVHFRTPSGVDAPSDTITVSLPSFSFGSVGVADIDLFYGVSTGLENATTLAASPAAGVWGVGISGNTITFTAPTNAAPGTIPTNSFVIIRIGTNAVGGVNQLTNPASPGSTEVGIGGTFGDTATMGVAIMTNDAVSVTAVVNATTTPPDNGGGGSQGGGGGGGGNGGANAPVISNIQIDIVSTSTVIITWTTDIGSNSLVPYGNSSAYASGTAGNFSESVTSHSVTLNNLLPNSLYHFKVSSTDLSTSLSSESADLTFTTLGDTQPPIITNLQVSNISDTSALVSWTTDEPATSLVEYGLTSSYGAFASAPGYTTNRVVSLSGLVPATAYHYRVISADGEGNVASSTDATFVTTPDMTPPPNVTNLSATPDDTVITLSWTNPSVPDFAGVRIQRQTSGFPTGPNNGTTIFQGTASAFPDAGLNNGTLYYYGVYAFDASGNFASGALISATPVGPTPPEPTPTSTPQEPPPTSTPPVAPSEPPTEPPSEPPPTETPPPEETPPSTVPPPSEGQTAPPAEPLPPGAVSAPGTGGAGGAGGGGSQAQVTGEVQAQFTTSDGTVLSTDAAGRIGVIPGSVVQVTIPLAGVAATTKAAFVAINGALYSLQLNPEGTAYSGSFTVPSNQTSTVTVSVQKEDGTYLAKNYFFEVQPGIWVTEQTVTGLRGPGIEGAIVTVFHDVNGTWEKYGTYITNSEGNVRVYGPNGRYYIEATAENALKSVSDPFEVRMNVLNKEIHLIRIPVRPPLPADATPAERVADAVLRAMDQATITSLVIRAAMDAPEVQQANAVAAPLALTISIINTASSLSLFNMLAFMQNLFTQPILLLGRKKRKRWGTIYNSLSKVPIELAIVRLVQFETKLVIQSKVTDKLGRYWFLARKGNYLIEVVKPEYVFPTQYLYGAAEDVELVDLYHGDKIELTEDEIIARNIPIDPALSEELPKEVLFKHALQNIKNGLAFGSIIVGMLVVLISPTAPSAMLLVAQIAAYLLFKRLGQPVKAKNWGIVYDSKTRKPMTRVIVRIFDKKFNKLLETQVTDQNGKFGFFVKENVYYITAEKPGYKKYTSADLDLRGKREAVVNQNVSLEPIP